MSRKRKENPVEQIGSKWEKLTIISQVIGVIGPKGLKWECQCNCSRQPHSRIEVWTEDLRSGRVGDCGCREKGRIRTRKCRAVQKRKQAATKTALRQRYTRSLQPIQNTRLTVHMMFDELMGLPA